MEDPCYIYEQYPVGSNKSLEYSVNPQGHAIFTLTARVQFREGKRILLEEIYDYRAVSH